MANMLRNFLLTINNPEQTDSEMLEYCKQLPHVKYVIFQREKGEETGTEHFQMYIEFMQGKTFDTMKKYFPRAHIEKRKGTKKQARDYCSKEDTRIGEVQEYGEFAEERERTDWTDILQMIADGCTNSQIREAFPSQWLRYYKAIEENREMLFAEKFGKIRRTNLEVYFITGGSGVGKTSYVLDKYGDENVFRMTDYGGSYNNERFDGYCAHDVIMFDEFRNQIPISKMLMYLDIYPLQLPARFHNKTACYTKVYVVSNMPLKSLYPQIQLEQPATYNAFLRRFKAVYNFNWSKKIAVPRYLWLAPESVLMKTSKGEQLKI